MKPISYVFEMRRRFFHQPVNRSFSLSPIVSRQIISLSLWPHPEGARAAYDESPDDHQFHYHSAATFLIHVTA
jgi:hypothetical protein